MDNDNRVFAWVLVGMLIYYFYTACIEERYEDFFPKFAYSENKKYVWNYGDAYYSTSPRGYDGPLYKSAPNPQNYVDYSSSYERF